MPSSFFLYSYHYSFRFVIQPEISLISGYGPLGTSDKFWNVLQTPPRLDGLQHSKCTTLNCRDACNKPPQKILTFCQSIHWVVDRGIESIICIRGKLGSPESNTSVSLLLLLYHISPANPVFYFGVCGLVEF